MYRARQEVQATAILLLHSCSCSFRHKSNLTLPRPSLYRHFNFAKANMPSHDAATTIAASALCVILLLVMLIILSDALSIGPFAKPPPSAEDSPRPTENSAPSAERLSLPAEETPPPAVQQQQQLQSRLVALPPELRNEIWLYAIPDTITLSKQDPLPRLPSISRTCRQILSEVTPLFLTKSTFECSVHDYDGAFMCEVVPHLAEFRAVVEQNQDSFAVQFRVSFTETGNGRIFRCGRRRSTRVATWCLTTTTSSTGVEECQVGSVLPCSWQ